MCTICQAFIEFVTIFNEYFYIFYIFLCLYILEKEMTTHSSTRAWKIPWMEEPGRRQSMGSQRARRDCAASLSSASFIMFLCLYIRCVYVLVFWLQGLWDLSSPIRD